jgi:hypothetical protein
MSTSPAAAAAVETVPTSPAAAGAAVAPSEAAAGLAPAPASSRPVDASPNRGRSSPRPPSASLAGVSPSVLEANRLSGTRDIVPEAATRLEISRSGVARAEGTYKLCLDTQGVVFSVSLLKSTGFPDYDAKIAAEMKHWTYKPYVLDGRIAAICASISVGYSPAAAPAPAPAAAPAPAPPSSSQPEVNPTCLKSSFVSVLQAERPGKATVQAALVRLKACEQELPADVFDDLQRQLIARLREPAQRADS